MAKAAKAAKAEDAAKPVESRVAPLRTRVFQVGLIGTTSLIVKKFSKKVEAGMIQARNTTVTEKGANKAPRQTPDEQVNDSRHLDAYGRDCIPGSAIGQSIRGAKKRIPGNEMGAVLSEALVRSIFVIDDTVPILCSKFRRRDDPGRNPGRKGGGAGVIIHRPEYEGWGCLVNIQYDEDLLTQQDVVNLIARAGVYCGLHEWRPSAPTNPGTHGMFRLADDAEFKMLLREKAASDKQFNVKDH